MKAQKEINLDSEFLEYRILRNLIPEKIDNINVLMKRITDLESDVEDNNLEYFVLFIKGLVTEKHCIQRNNHNLMKTFLSEKINNYCRIQYHLLDEKLKDGKLPYAKNLAPKKIMSNYFMANETESTLNVSTLENSFCKFTTSEAFLLKEKNNSNNMETIENIRRYFALQLTRREYFLYDILNLCLNYSHKEIKNLDLLDYLYLKYIYNSSLFQNFNNWLEFIGNGNITIYQCQYKKCLLNINYFEILNSENKPTEKDYVNSDMAITENHTFIVNDLLNSINIKRLNSYLQSNNFNILTETEIDEAKKILVTIGSDNKLVFLMNSDENVPLLRKIDFAIHHFWDECMIHFTILNLLLKKDSELNNVEYFKNANISPTSRERAKFMNSMFTLSKNMENNIKEFNKKKRSTNC